MYRMIGELQFSEEVLEIEKYKAIVLFKDLGYEIVVNGNKYYIIKEGKDADR